MDTTSDAKPARRRRHDAELKRQVIAACAVPGASVAQVAMSYGLNANLVHKWRRLACDGGELPIDNNWVENRIRPIALGRQNWLFAGSRRVGKRAAAVMGLIHSAKLNGLDPYVYVRDVLELLPTQPASRSAELLPHRWSPKT